MVRKKNQIMLFNNVTLMNTILFFILFFSCIVTVQAEWVNETIFPDNRASISVIYDSLDHPHILSRSSGIFIYSYHDGTQWIREEIPYASQTHSRLLLDLSGNPFFCYVTPNPPSTEVINELRYAKRTDSGWVSEIIDTNISSLHSDSLTKNLTDTPFIAYAKRVDRLYSSILYAYQDINGWKNTSIHYGNVWSPLIVLNQSGYPDLIYTYKSDFDGTSKRIYHSYYTANGYTKNHIKQASSSVELLGLQISSLNMLSLVYHDPWYGDVLYVGEKKRDQEWAFSNPLINGQFWYEYNAVSSTPQSGDSSILFIQSVFHDMYDGGHYQGAHINSTLGYLSKDGDNWINETIRWNPAIQSGVPLGFSSPINLAFNKTGTPHVYYRSPWGIQHAWKVPDPFGIISPGTPMDTEEILDSLTPTFVWTPTGEAIEYGLYISKEPYGEENIVFNSTEKGISITSSPFILPQEYALDPDTKYRWNMNYRTNVGWSPVSSRLYFKTPAVNDCNNPTIIIADEYPKLSDATPDMFVTFFFNISNNCNQNDVFILESNPANLIQYEDPFNEISFGPHESKILPVLVKIKDMTSLNDNQYVSIKSKSKPEISAICPINVQHISQEEKFMQGSFSPSYNWELKSSKNCKVYNSNKLHFAYDPKDQSDGVISLINTLTLEECEIKIRCQSDFELIQTQFDIACDSFSFTNWAELEFFDYRFLEHCFPISHMCSAFYIGLLKKPYEYQQDCVFSIPKEKLWIRINADLWLTYLGNAYSVIREAPFGDPDQKFLKMKNLINQDVPVILGVVPSECKNDEGAHAVVAYKILEFEDLAYIYLYENQADPFMSDDITPFSSMNVAIYDKIEKSFKYWNRDLFIVTDPRDPLFLGKIAKIACPVNITIVDEKNRILCDNFINEIPNASIKVFDEEKIVYLPDNHTYNMTISAYNAGTYSIQILESNSSYSSSSHYSNITIVKNSQSYLKLNGDSGEKIYLDHNNDGLIDDIISPNYYSIINQSYPDRNILEANFTSTNRIGSIPLSVNFYDNSYGNPIEWNWSFGDGSTSSDQNPIHTYATPGIYSVSLLIKNNDSISSIVNKNYISVLSPSNMHIINSSSSLHGTITPKGSVSVPTGSNQIFTIIPDPNYFISDVTVDNINVGTNSTYTFTNVSSNHTIHANFSAYSDPSTWIIDMKNLSTDQWSSDRGYGWRTDVGGNWTYQIGPDYGVSSYSGPRSFVALSGFNTSAARGIYLNQADATVNINLTAGQALTSHTNFSSMIEVNSGKVIFNSGILNTTTNVRTNAANGIILTGDTAHAEINGGLITGYYYGLQLLNGTSSFNDGTISAEMAVFLQNGQATINNGFISGYEGIRMYNGSISINGGSFQGIPSGLIMWGGTVTMNGGTITGEDRGFWVNGGSVIVNGGEIRGISGITIGDAAPSSDMNVMIQSPARINGTFSGVQYGVFSANPPYNNASSWKTYLSDPDVIVRGTSKLHVEGNSPGNLVTYPGVTISTGDGVSPVYPVLVNLTSIPGQASGLPDIRIYDETGTLCFDGVRNLSKITMAQWNGIENTPLTFHSSSFELFSIEKIGNPSLSVQTLPAENITLNSARLIGNLSASDRYPCTVWFGYTETLSEPYTLTENQTLNGPGLINTTIINLKDSTRYYHTIFASNSNETVNGSVLNFTTHSTQVPVITAIDPVFDFNNKSVNEIRIVGEHLSDATQVKLQSVLDSSNFTSTSVSYDPASTTLTASFYLSGAYREGAKTDDFFVNVSNAAGEGSNPAIIYTLHDVWSHTNSITPDYTYSGNPSFSANITGSNFDLMGGSVHLLNLTTRDLITNATSVTRINDTAIVAVFNLVGIPGGTYIVSVPNREGSWSSGAHLEVRDSEELSISTLPATNISRDSAVLHGNLTKTGENLNYVKFCYGRNPNGPFTDTSTQELTNPGPFSVFLSNLTSSTTYYYNAVASNQNGTVKGSVLSFVTDGDIPPQKNGWKFRSNLNNTGEYVLGDLMPTNNKIWDFQVGSGDSSPSFYNGVVYIGGAGKMYALSKTNGQKIWEYSTGNVITSSPAVLDGVVYFGCWDGKIYALSCSTGEKLWDFTTDNSISSSPAVSDGVVYIGSYDGKVYALSTAEGKKLWEFSTGNVITSSPAVLDGVVYFGCWDGKIYALSCSTGAKLWDYTTGGPVQSSPMICKGVVYVGSDDGNLYALSSKTGENQWQFSTGGPILSSPAEYSNVIYFGSSDGKIYALTRITGEKFWDYPTGGGVTSSPAVVSAGVVFAGSGDGRIYALSSSTGEKRWEFNTGDYVPSSPAISDGVVYCASANGNLYALGSGSSTAPTVRSITPVSGQAGTTIQYFLEGNNFRNGAIVNLTFFGMNNITSIGELSGTELTGSIILPINSQIGSWNVSVNQNGFYSNDDVLFNVIAPPIPTVTPTVTPTVAPTPSVNYTFDVKSDDIGWIDPSGVFSVDPGTSLSFTFKPTAGANIKNLTVNGIEQSTESPFVISGVDKDYLIRLNNEPLPGVVIAAFTVESVDGYTITFRDNSWGEVNQWKWDFGDGSFGTGNPVSHTYSTPRSYSVSLWVRSDLSQSQVVIGDIIIPMSEKAGLLTFGP